jgi:hypothetical protein
MLDTTYLDLVTRKHFEPAMQNQIYDRFVLWNELNSGGQIKTLTGTALQWNVVAVEHQALGLLSGYEAMANQQINPLKQATLNPAFYYATVGISQEEETKNSGNMEKLIDIVSTQVENSRTSFQKRMQTDAYGAGSTVDGKTPLIGLEAIIDDDNTYAGLDRSSASNAFWKSNINSTAHTFVNLQDSTSSSYLPRIMRNSFTSATHDLAPNLGITTKAIYNLYQDIAGDKLRINNEMADLGFGGAEFQGGALRLAFDDYCTADHLYFLTMANFNLWVYSGMNFNSDGWKVPTDQAAKITHFYWMGQLQCDTPRQQAVIRSIATS